MKRFPDPFPLRFRSPEDGYRFVHLLHERKSIPDNLVIRPGEPGYEEAIYELAYVYLEPGEELFK